MPERRAIGPVDNIWLNMDRPNNLMVIDAVMWFEETIQWSRLAPLLQHRLVDRFPVFSQRPVIPANPLGTPHWEDDPDFDLTRHVRLATLPIPGDQEALQRFVETRMSVPFDREHPMWDVTLVEGYGSGCALVLRFHHALADGIALSQVLLSLTDATPTADVASLDGLAGFEREVDRPAQLDTSSEEHPYGLVGGVVGGVVDTAQTVLDAGADVVRGGLHTMSLIPELAHPSRVGDLLELAWKTGKIANKLLLGSNPQSIFSGEPGVEKRAVWSGPRSIADVKRVTQLTGGTVNDVLLAAVSGAINTYVQEQGDKPVDLTTMIPVNVRRPDRPLPRELGNKFALVLLKLPTGIGPVLQRVAESKRRMDAIKSSPEAMITFGVNNLIGRIEPHLEKEIINFFSNKAIGVTTNVVGPREQRYLAGAAICGAVSWVPGAGNQSLGVCIFSLAGTVRVGFKVDAAMLPNPEKLVHAFDEEMDHLLWIANRSD